MLNLIIWTNYYYAFINTYIVICMYCVTSISFVFALITTFILSYDLCYKTIKNEKLYKMILIVNSFLIYLTLVSFLIHFTTLINLACGSSIERMISSDNSYIGIISIIYSIFSISIILIKFWKYKKPIFNRLEFTTTNIYPIHNAVKNLFRNLLVTTISSFASKIIFLLTFLLANKDSIFVNSPLNNKILLFTSILFGGVDGYSVLLEIKIGKLIPNWSYSNLLEFDNKLEVICHKTIYPTKCF